MRNRIEIKEFIDKIRDLLIAPGNFWISVKNEKTGKSKLLFHYYFPLTLIAAFAVFLGTWLGSAHFFVVLALLIALHKIIFLIVIYFINVILVSKLTGFFGGEKKPEAIQKLVVYSMTPYFLVQVVTGLFPWLYALSILALYGGYLFWLGSKMLIKLPEKKIPGFVFTSLLVFSIVFVFLFILFDRIFNTFN